MQRSLNIIAHIAHSENQSCAFFAKKVQLNARCFVWGIGFDKVLLNPRQSSDPPCRLCVGSWDITQVILIQLVIRIPRALSCTHELSLVLRFRLYRTHLEALKSWVETDFLELLSSLSPQPKFYALEALYWSAGAVQRGWPEPLCMVLAPGWWHLETLLCSPCSCASKRDVISFYFHSMW